MRYDVNQILKEFSSLTRFDDGRINYAGSARAAVVVCFVKVGAEILMLKRSERVSTYRGKWQTVAGYIDELKLLKEKVLEELCEEIGLSEKQIQSFVVGNFFEYHDVELGRTWIVYPALVILNKKPKIELDFEHTDFCWIQPKAMKTLDIVPNAEIAWEKVKSQK